MSKNQQVLSLYRLLLRKGRQLQFTDKEFYFRRIREEFEKNRNLTKASEIETCVQVHWSRDARKSVSRISDLVGHKPTCTVSEKGCKLGISDFRRRGMVLFV